MSVSLSFSKEVGVQGRARGEGETDEGEEVKDPLDLSVWATDVQI